MNRLPYLPVLLFYLICCWSFESHGQTSRADSLFAICSDTTRSPIERVEVFYQRFNPLFVDEGDNPEATRWIPYLEEVKQLAIQHGLEKYMGRFLILEVGAYTFTMNNLEKGCELTPQAIKAAWEAHDYPSLSFAMMALKSCQESHLAQLDQGTIELVKEINMMLQQDTFYREKLPLYMPLLIDAYQRSQFPRALDIAQNVIKAHEETNSPYHEDYIEALAYAGSIMHLIGNFQESEKYLLTALGPSNKNKSSLGRVNIDLARLYASKQEIKKAHARLDSALHIMAGEERCKPCFMRTHRIRAEILNQEGKYQEALESLEKASYFYEQEEQSVGVKHNIGGYYSALCTAYLGLKEYTKAISIAEKGIKKMNGNLFSCLQNYWVIFKSHEALGNHEQALASYQQYVSARDTITALRNSQEVTKKEITFQYEQQKLADELLYQKQLGRERNNRNILMALGIIAALIAVGFYFRYRWAQKTKAALETKNQQIEAEKEKAKASELAKQQFLANMSHEIRTPMNAIKGMTDILLRRQPTAAQLNYLSAIKESSTSLLVIINDILDLSKIDAGKVDFEEIPFSLTGVIDNVMTIMQFKAEEKGLQLKTDIDALEEQQVIGDPTRLHQILLNLTGNAIKFTEKGVVTIQLKRDANDPKGLRAQFCVSDTGVGIGKDRLDKIFESFEQAYTDTSRKFGGTGLGLTISRKLVELQDGKIWAESQKGKGSQFYVSIPYALADEKAVAEVGSTNNEAILSQLKSIKVLLVEDNKFNAIVAQEELEDSIEDAEVTVAENGLIAVEQLKSGDFDVVLMDVQMPVMNGYEATRAIRQLENDKAAIPIIAMTANVMKEEVERCYAAGMNDFIGKPFEVEELLETMYKELNVNKE